MSKKDLYVNSSNHDRYNSIIQECKRRGISSSDTMINAAYSVITNQQPAALCSAAGEDIKEQSLLSKLITIANRIQNEGIDDLSLSYLLPRQLDMGEITLEDVVNLIMMCMKLNIIITRTAIFKDALMMTNLVGNESIKNSESDGYRIYTKNLLVNMQQRYVKQQEEKRLQLKNKELEKEKEEWTRQHPDIPFYLRNFSKEDREIFIKIEKGEWVEDLA